MTEAQDTGERFNFQFAMHAKLTKGGSLYVYRCEDFGITRTEHRATSRDPWRCTFTADEIDGQEFDTLGECVRALRLLHPPGGTTDATA